MNADPSPRRLTIVGWGLLGASVAAAVNRHRRRYHVTAVSRRPADQLTGPMRPDVVVDNVTGGCLDADVVVIATPVDEIAQYVNRIAPVAIGGIITDVGSTKAKIVAAVGDDEAPLFVPAHPIAGSEKSGCGNATADLFENRVVVLTPTNRTFGPAVEQATEFWQSTGATIQTMSPADHDAALARTSHLPHVLAAAAARAVIPELLSLVGTGWSDTSRVAGGTPSLWTAIVRHNADAVLTAIDNAADDLQSLREAIASDDAAAIEAWFAHAKSIRDAARP